jgi:threonine dehydratase
MESGSMALTSPRLRAPSLDEIRQAAAALRGVAVYTPLLTNPDINAQQGGRLFIKAENLQRTGAFKFRGAYNRIRQMSVEEQKAGAITYSSGNHGQAVASAAEMFGTNGLIVMPKDAPEAKIRATRDLGAEITFFDRETQNKDEVVARLQAQSGRVLVPPSEDVRVLAGAATVPLELICQAEEAGVVIDEVLVPCGGGGLSAATALVFEALSPQTKVFACEPEQFDDTRMSFEAGERIAVPSGRETICDAIKTDRPGELTFSINKEKLAGVLTVSDDEVRRAMKFAFENYKTVIEPGGVVGLAAVMAGKTQIKNRTIAVIATGGNVDSERFCSLVSASGRAS